MADQFPFYLNNWCYDVIDYKSVTIAILQNDDNSNDIENKEQEKYDNDKFCIQNFSCSPSLFY